MMSRSVWLFSLVLALVVLLAGNAQAIYCYGCESVYEPGCADDFEAEAYFKLDCSRLDPPRYLDGDLENRNASGCMKREYMELNSKRVVRSCFFGDLNDTEIGCRLDPSMADVQDERCYVCTESYCNHGGRPEGGSLLGMSAIVLLFTIAISFSQRIEGL